MDIVIHLASSMDQAISHATQARRIRIKAAIALALLAGFCAAAWGINRAARPSVDAGELVIAEVRRGDIANTINASGIVIPEHEELVPCPAASRVRRVHAKLGATVAAGELLLELDERETRLALDGLREQLAQQENRIVGLTLELEQKRKQLVSNIELLELDLQSASVKWERYQKLRKSGAVSGEDMLTAELNVKRTQIQLRQQRELIEDSRRSTQTSVDGARLQKAMLQKQIDQQQLLLERMQVKAPFAGVLTALAGEEGASVAAGQLLAKVSELNNFRVEASVSDFHARLLAPGQAVRVEQGGSVLAGRIHTVLPEIQNGTIKLIVALDQPRSPQLRDKMRVDVGIITEQKSGTLVVAAGPAFNGRGRQAVFVVREGVAIKTMLELGANDGKLAEIVAGARLGDRLIVSDTARFKELDRLRIAQ